MEEIITKDNLNSYTRGLKNILGSMGEAILNAGSSDAGEEVITITHSNGTGSAHVEVKSGDTVLNANVASGGTVSVPFGIEYTIRALDSNGSTIKEITKVASRMSSSYSFDLTDISVDLGLPSGKIWALHNVGSSSDDELGYIFSYGNITFTPHLWYRDAYYSTPGGRLTNGFISGDPKYDAARAIMGGDWRTPTKEEWEELISNVQSNGRTNTTTINNVQTLLMLLNLKGIPFSITTRPYTDARNASSYFGFIDSSSSYLNYMSTTPYTLPVNNSLIYTFNTNYSSSMKYDWVYYPYFVRAIRTPQ